MSAIDHPTQTNRTLQSLPEFALCWLPDDPNSPREITVFPRHPRAELTTEWITVDADHAVPLDVIR